MEIESQDLKAILSKKKKDLKTTKDEKGYKFLKVKERLREREKVKMVAQA